MDHTLEKILARVQKPGRYVGGGIQRRPKDKSTVDCRFAFCFPDTYEIGMSNLGMRILYGVMNEMDGVWCERVFAPWGDMEAEMRREGLPSMHWKAVTLSRNLTSSAFPWAMKWPTPMYSTCWTWLGFPCAARTAPT